MERVRVVIERPTEVRADSFAAASLMPADDLKHRVGRGLDRRAFSRLVVDFKVSPSAMAIRLRCLGLLGDAGSRI